MKKSWFIAGASYTLKEVKELADICGWTIKGSVVYSDMGYVVGWKLS